MSEIETMLEESQKAISDTNNRIMENVERIQSCKHPGCNEPKYYTGKNYPGNKPFRMSGSFGYCKEHYFDFLDLHE